MKVKIKTWEAMEKEFGLTYNGDIASSIQFLTSMENNLPVSRIVEVNSDLKWIIEDNNGWCLSYEMIDFIVDKSNKQIWKRKADRMKRRAALGY